MLHLKPEFGVFPALWDIVDDEGNNEHDDCAQGGGDNDIEVPELVHAFTADHRNKSCRPTRWVQGHGQVHHRDRDGNGRGGRQPGLSAQPLEGGHPDNGGKDMPAEEISRLGQRTANGAVDEHRRSPERADDQHQTHLIKYFVMDEGHRGET